MSARSISIFVCRRMGMFHASSIRVEAIHAESATLAARSCAAAHYDVPEAWIQLTPFNENVLIATVERPTVSFVRGCLRRAAKVFGRSSREKTTALLTYTKGGAR